MFSKLVKSYTQLVEMLFSGMWEDDYVVQVDEAIYQIQLS